MQRIPRRTLYPNRTQILLGLAAIAYCLAFSTAITDAQNVTGYGTMNNAHLFLIREPAVHRDLELSEEQQQKIDAINAQLDPTLLAIRNKGDANEQFDKLTVESEKQIDAVLNKTQRRRMSQIRLRLRGWRSLLLPKLAAKIGLSEEQVADVQKTVDEHDAAVKKLQEDIQAGTIPQDEAQTEAAEKLTVMEEGVQNILTAEQFETFLGIMGKEFPLNELQRVAFQSPGFAPDQNWLNSEPLTLEKLKGKVVALHFFAFA